jgi:hypothetical protein
MSLLKSCASNVHLPSVPFGPLLQLWASSYSTGRHAISTPTHLSILRTDTFSPRLRRSGLKCLCSRETCESGLTTKAQPRRTSDVAREGGYASAIRRWLQRFVSPRCHTHQSRLSEPHFGHSVCPELSNCPWQRWHTPAVRVMCISTAFASRSSMPDA